MEIIRPDTNINFVGMRYKAFVVSAVIILLGVAVLFWRGGILLGVDFAGGTVIQVKFQQPTGPGPIREALAGMAFSDSAIQQIGTAAENEFLLRTDVSTSDLQSLSQAVEASLVKAFGDGQVTVLRTEMVGPKVGEDLRQKALFAIYYAMLLIAIYISGRFELKWVISGVMAGVMIVGVYLLEGLGLPVFYLTFGALLTVLVLCWLLRLPYALGAIFSLVHDVLITAAFFALAHKEFSLEVVAAFLTLIGYSLNDTIIVYDRIRENLHKSRKQDLKVVINQSINQTLGRTILTSGGTLFMVIALFFLGGSVIHDFAFALLIGIITGTYSSVFVASPLLIFYEDWTTGRMRRKVPRPT
jgi:preprotein translocase subunit SecF